MNIEDYKRIKSIMAGQMEYASKITAINEILKPTDINDVISATKLCEQVLGSATVKVTLDSKPTVHIGDVVADHPMFGLAFMTALMRAIEDKALDKFLPEPKQPKTASAGKRDGLASPSATRNLPIRGGNY